MSLLYFHLLLHVKYSVSFARNRDSEFFGVWRKLDAWSKKKKMIESMMWILEFCWEDCNAASPNEWPDLTLELPRLPNIQILCWKILFNKPYLAIVLLKRYHLNGNIMGFSTQIEKLELRTGWIAPCESTTKEVSFEWSQHSISFKDSNTRSSSTLYIFRVACEIERI